MEQGAGGALHRISIVMQNFWRYLDQLSFINNGTTVTIKLLSIIDYERSLEWSFGLCFRFVV